MKLESTAKTLDSLYLEIAFYIAKGYPYIRIQPFGIGYKITARKK